MATTINNIQVDFGFGATPPRVTFLQGADMDLANIQDTLRQIEASAEGVSALRPRIISASGNEAFSLDGSVTNALTITVLEPYEMQFEAGPIQFQTSNGNLLGTFLDSPGAIVQINNAVGSLNVSSNQIEFSSFAGGVWVDQTAATTGTGLTAANIPKGSAQAPVNNFPDAVTIANQRGLPKTIYIIGDATLDTGDDVSGFVLIGQNAVRSTITFNAAAVTNGCEVQEARVLGNLDGGTILRNCVIDNLNYINGFVYSCMIDTGTISLGGSNTAHFLDCYSGVPGVGTPIIDCNGLTNDQDTPLAIRNYNGGIQLDELTGGGAVSIDLNSGQVKINTNCTNGTVVVRGNGKVIDQNGNALVSGTINGGLTLLNEVSFGVQIQEMWESMELDTAPGRTLRENVWDAPIANHSISATFGGWMQSKLLTVARFLSLK